MPARETVHVDVTGVALTDPAGDRVKLARLSGVQVLVLMRHRH